MYRHQLDLVVEALILLHDLLSSFCRKGPRDFVDLPPLAIRVLPVLATLGRGAGLTDVLSSLLHYL